MGADLHVKGVSMLNYLDDEEAFLEEHGEPPGLDVTLLRDHEAVPEHIKQLLYHDMAPDEALVLSDAMALNARYVPAESARAALRLSETASWLRHWAGSEVRGVEGIH